jgi:hypothetical protein
MRVFDEGYGELDELGDVLGGLDGFCGVDVVGLAGDDGFVGDAGVEFGVLAVEENCCAKDLLV